MRIDITPGPSADERAAIEQALAEPAKGGAGERGPWWRQGLLEAIGEEDET